nr:glycoside hydrolase family 3 C-terminal domain-containing protein [Calditrichia bacterium]
RLLAIGKPLVTLLFNGRPKSITALSEKVPALLECWYLGQETGNVVAELLFGDINPSGKLPISFPRSVGHIPCFYNHKPSARRGYLKESVAPLYPFGYGLSYTTFAIGEIKLAKTVISAEEKTSISATLQNTGAVAGAEVVQLYIRDHHSSVTRPVKELKGFKKVFLKPGQKATVVLEIGPDQLAFTNIDMKYTVEPGGFDIMIGTSSRDEDLQKVTLRVE